MLTIAIAIQKGGSGKTTTAINLAAALNHAGKKVLLIDFDPQANLSQALGISTELEENIYPLLLQQASIKRTHLGKPIDPEKTIKKVHGLHIIPASLKLADAELELISIFGREKLLSQLIKPLKSQYDYIFIDCPPAIGMLTVNALSASDYVLIPLQAEFLPLKGVESFLNTYESVRKQINKKLKILGFVLTKYDHRKQMNRNVLEQLFANYGSLVFNTRIRNNIALAQSQENGKPIFQYDTTTNGALDYMQLAQEFSEKINQ